jgi:hypothetical protein
MSSYNNQGRSYGRGDGPRGNGGGRQGNFNNKRLKTDPWNQQDQCIDVLTNFFHVGLNVSNRETKGYYAYNIEILDAVRPKVVDNTTNIELFEVEERPKKNPKAATSNHPELARAVVERLKANLWQNSKMILAVS